jgi:hypothetical protein
MKFWLTVVALGVFSVERLGGAFLLGRRGFKNVAARRIFQPRRLTRAETQRTRKKALAKQNFAPKPNDSTRYLSSASEMYALVHSITFLSASAGYA